MNSGKFLKMVERGQKMFAAYSTRICKVLAIGDRSIKKH